MIYAEVPNIDKPVSRIVYGTATAQMMNNEVPYELLDAVLECGVNTFDTAISYGESEVALGRWIRERNVRDSVVVITKGCRNNKWRHRTTEYDLRSDFEDSTARLGLDYIDIYMLHRDDISAEVGPIVEVLNRLKNDGRLRAFGASNWSHKRIGQANMYAQERGLTPFTVASPAYSLAEVGCDPFKTSTSLNGEANREAREWYAGQQLALITYSGLARGFLSGVLKSADEHRAEEVLRGLTRTEYAHPQNFERLRRAELIAEAKGVSVPAVALAWLLKQPLGVFPIVSPGSSGHFFDTLRGLDVELGEREAAWLNLEAEYV